MDWGSLIVGLGGLAVAALSVVLNYRERTTKFREMLYSKQLEGFAKIVEVLAVLHSKAQTFIVQNGCVLNDKTKPELRAFLIPELTRYQECFQQWFVFLPTALTEALASFLGALNGISAPPSSKLYPYEHTHASDPGMLLAKAFEHVNKEARKALGTQPLTEKTLQEIGRQERPE